MIQNESNSKLVFYVLILKWVFFFLITLKITTSSPQKNSAHLINSNQILTSYRLLSFFEIFNKLNFSSHCCGLYMFSLFISSIWSNAYNCSVSLISGGRVCNPFRQNCRRPRVPNLLPPPFYRRPNPPIFHKPLPSIVHQ